MSISDIILYIVNVVVIILFNIFITNVFESISNNNELKNQLSLYEKQSRIEYDYYKRLENKYADSRKVIHDIKNHLQIIEELYKDAQEHKAEKYTDDMYRMLDNLSQRRYSTNKVLNIILNDKIEKVIPVNSLGNMCVLHESVNRGYGNDFFLEKRIDIMRKSQDGYFIRPHVYDAFNKIFLERHDESIDMKMMNRWDKSDILARREYIISVY